MEAAIYKHAGVVKKRLGSDRTGYPSETDIVGTELGGEIKREREEKRKRESHPDFVKP